MLDCLILGDSIAVGTQMFKPECALYAHGGWTTHRWLKEYRVVGKDGLQSDTVIISLGTNDPDGADTYEQLKTVRAMIQNSRVYWILPSIKPAKQEAVNRVAKEFNDTVISTARLQPDGIHPSWAGYRELVSKAK